MLTDNDQEYTGKWAPFNNVQKFGFFLRGQHIHRIWLKHQLMFLTIGISQRHKEKLTRVLRGHKLPSQEEFPIIGLDHLLQLSKLLIRHRPIAYPQLPELVALQQPSDGCRSKRNSSRNLKHFSLRFCVGGATKRNFIFQLLCHLTPPWSLKEISRVASL